MGKSLSKCQNYNLLLPLDTLPTVYLLHCSYAVKRTEVQGVTD